MAASEVLSPSLVQRNSEDCTRAYVGQFHSPGTPLDAAADVTLLSVYGAVGFFFAVRFIRHRKWPSFYLAVSAPLGWSLLALWDLGLVMPVRGGLFRWLGVTIGVLMLTSVVGFDNAESKGQKP